MSDTPEYLHQYQNPKVDEAYRLFVDGKGSQRGICELTGLSRRSLQRKASPDGWTEERTERARVRAHGAVMAQLEPGIGGGPDLEDRIRELMSSEDTRLRVGAVMARQRIFWDGLSEDLTTAYAEKNAVAKKNKRRLSAGELFPFVALGEKIAQQQRKAHGIPDLTKLEIDDKSAARLHAEAIGKRRQARLAIVESTVIPSGEGGVGQHGPM
jgi:hypothetical protein